MNKHTELKILELEQIEFGQRYREDYGDIDDLVVDIQKHGVIQPLAVVAPKNPEGLYHLLAGGRRYTAAKKAGIPTVPVNVYSKDLSNLDIRGIELAENLCRKDLEWREQIKLQQEIHRLYQKIHGPKEGTAKVTPGQGWGERDTAKLVNKSQGSVHQDLDIAAALDVTPELFSTCKNKHDASKVLRNIRENQLKEELARRVESKSKTAPAVSSKDSKLISLSDSYQIGDLHELIKKVPDGSVDIVEFDPPYAINLTKGKKTTDSSGGTAHGYQELPEEEYTGWITKALRECYRAMSDHSWLVLWFAPEPWFEGMYRAIRLAGFSCSRMPGLWIKGGSGQNQHPDVNLTNSYEMFFYARKGAPAVSKRGRSNVFPYSPVPSQSKRHPTERPTSLIMEILSTFGDAGSKVMVPCLGSGATILAADQLGMEAFGFDIDNKHKHNFVLAVEQHLTEG